MTLEIYKYTKLIKLTAAFSTLFFWITAIILLKTFIMKGINYNAVGHAVKGIKIIDRVM